MNEVVKFQSDAGQIVEITPQDVKSYLCPQANDKEIAMFLELCRAQHLNPWIKDAYLVKYGNNPASIITGKETFTKRANANPNYEGIEHGIVFMRKLQGGAAQVDKREGAAVYKAAGETLLGGWARVFVKGKKPVYCELALDEYSTGKSNWAKMPAVMIDKCAQVAALRLAFPSDFQGLYAAEEMGNAGEVAQKMEDAPAPTKNSDPINVDFVEMISDEQAVNIGVMVAELSELRGVTFNAVYDSLYASKTMQQAGAVNGEEMTAEQAGYAITLLGRWIEKAREQYAQDVEQDEHAADAELEAEQKSRLETVMQDAENALFGEQEYYAEDQAF